MLSDESRRHSSRHTNFTNTSIDIFNLELKSNSVVFTDENSSFTVKGILKSSGIIHVSSGAAFTIGDFIATSSLSKLVFHHKTKNL